MAGCLILGSFMWIRSADVCVRVLLVSSSGHKNNGTGVIT
jgi:hypothetical protein